MFGMVLICVKFVVIIIIQLYQQKRKHANFFK